MLSCPPISPQAFSSLLNEARVPQGAVGRMAGAAVPFCRTADQSSAMRHGETKAEMGDTSKYCCEQMRGRILRACEQHPEPKDCPDCIVRYYPGAGQFGIP